MKSRFLIVGLLIALGSSDRTLATSFLPNVADIREIDGAPAACLPTAYGERIQLQGAYLMENSLQGGEAANQWILELAPGGKPMTLHPGACVVFDRPVSDYNQKRGIKQLEEGKTYTFVLERGDHLNRLRSHNYIGSFCVMRLPNRELAYLPYIRQSNGTMTYPTCVRRRSGGPPAPDGIVPLERAP